MTAYRARRPLAPALFNRHAGLHAIVSEVVIGMPTPSGISQTWIGFATLIDVGANKQRFAGYARTYCPKARSICSGSTPE
jgi:hypothetical protein